MPPAPMRGPSRYGPMRLPSKVLAAVPSPNEGLVFSGS